MFIILCQLVIIEDIYLFVKLQNLFFILMMISYKLVQSFIGDCYDMIKKMMNCQYDKLIKLGLVISLLGFSLLEKGVQWNLKEL